MIKLIAAVGCQRELGKKGELIWRLRGDMAFFKTQTIGHIVVMGATTFKSLPKKLHDRIHYVLTRGSVQDNGENDVRVFTEVAQLIEEMKMQSYKQDVYVIGGEAIYSLLLELADEILLTEINATDKSADAYFPDFDKSKYTRYVLASNEENGIEYSHVRYVRN